MDNDTSFQELKDKVQKFCEDRDWDQFHSPKELAIGIITESSELLAHFRFKSDEEMEEIGVRAASGHQEEAGEALQGHAGLRVHD